MATLQQFNLPKAGVDGYDGDDTALNAESFSPKVRAYHVDRLPQYAARIQEITCAYCGKGKDIRSIRVDHIVPIAVWTRHICFNSVKDFAAPPAFHPYSRPARRPNIGAKISWDATPEAGPPAEAVAYEEKIRTVSANAVPGAVRDTDNLLLCCAKCNGSKSDRLPDKVVADRWGQDDKRSYYDRALQHTNGSPLNKVILDNQATLTRYRNGGRGSKFVLDGFKGNVRRTGDFEAFIQSGVTNQLAGTRPPMYLAELVPILMQRQTVQTIDRSQLRTCLYCLGFYHKQAFSLDHIQPVLRGQQDAFGQGSVAKRAAAYNKISNLVAVCGSCNSSKNSMPLTLKFITDRIDARIASGLAGFESVQDMSKEKGIKEVRRIFNL